MAKKWLRPMTGTMAIARRVLDICTSAARRPIPNCRPSTKDNLKGSKPPETKLQPASKQTQAMKEKLSTGLLPKRSNREPTNQRLLRPPRNDVEETSRIFP